MSEETVDKIRQKIMNSLKKTIRRTSFETHISLACYTETITNETLQTATRMDFIGLFTIFQMHFFQIAEQRSASLF